MLFEKKIKKKKKILVALKSTQDTQVMRISQFIRGIRVSLHIDKRPLVGYKTFVKYLAKKPFKNKIK